MYSNINLNININFIKKKQMFQNFNLFCLPRCNSLLEIKLEND